MEKEISLINEPKKPEIGEIYGGLKNFGEDYE